MRFPPEAYLIGAQKAGTTTLASLLDQHPSICLSNPKEPQFFSESYERGMEWYRKCFKPAEGAMLLDASTTYTMAGIDAHGRASPVIAQRIYQASPDARLIYLLREPAARVYSGYLHSRRTGYESKPLRQAITDNPNYLETSRYAAQAAPFIECFGRDSILFLSFEELSRDPGGTVRCVFDFLQVPDREFMPVDTGAKNQAFQYTTAGKTLRDLLGSERRISQLGQLVRTITPNFMHSYIKGIIENETETLSEADRNFLQSYFIQDNARLFDLSGIKFN